MHTRVVFNQKGGVGSQVLQSIWLQSVHIKGLKPC
jgi:hypothetical protein